MTTNAGDTRPVIEWDRDKLNRLKRLHAQAKDKDYETFLFEGHTILTRYATQLINYLEGKLA